MPKQSISRQAFLVLHRAILEQYHRDCASEKVTVPKTKAQIYGYGDHEEYSYSIVKFMYQHPAIAEYLATANAGKKPREKDYQVINGKNLYNKLRDAEKNITNDITLTIPYSPVYFMYIGCQDFEEFKQKYDLTDVFEVYEGFYFSQRDNQVKSFDLKITYTDFDCQAELTRFHEGNRPEPFEGIGLLKSKNLFLNLTNEEDVELKLIIPLEGKKISLQTYMLGVLTTISSDDFPLSVRVLFAKKTSIQDQIPVENQSLIRRYITLHRQNLRAPNERILDLSNLAIRGEFIADLAMMIGKYWIWQYLGDDILQIRMIIEDDFTVRITNPLYEGSLADQVGIINISKIFDPSLCISTFPERRQVQQQIISFFMIELPQRRDHGQYFKGVFCTVEQQKDEPFGGPLSIYKERPDDDFSDVKPQIIDKNDISDYLDEFVELLPVKTKLDILSNKTFPEELE